MYRLIPLVLLAACAAAPPPPAAGFRNPQSGIYSNAVFQPSRLAGDWVQVADFAAPGAAPCAPGRLRLLPQGGGVGIDGALCLDGQVVQIAGTAAVTGPGRLTVPGTTAPLAGDWWVLWADDGYRTLVIGTPSGGFGFILNRDAALPPDRLQAAREILDFNGYDLTRLRMLR